MQTSGLSAQVLVSAQSRLALYQAHQPYHADTVMGDESAFALSNSEAVISHYVSNQTKAENQIRDHLVELTPIGTSPEQTLKVITDVLHKSAPRGYKRNYFTFGPEGPPYKEMYIAGNIGLVYDHEDGWFFVGTDTVVNWYFDDQDHLFNITVQTHAVGL